MKVVTAQTMAWIDRTTIEQGRPGIELMRNAGAAIADSIERSPGVSRDSRVCVVAGKGNNGGDGFRIAELLTLNGHVVDVFIIGSPEKVRGDALTSLEDMKKAGCDVAGVAGDSDCESLQAKISRADVIVDALFGTGLSGEIEGLPARVIEMINSSDALVFAVDVPSGVDASTGRASSATVRADHTVTFGCLKTGHILHPGKRLCGRISIADIGFLPEVIDEAEEVARALVASEARDLIPCRPADAHKGSVGKVLVIAGSRGLTGAASLSSLAALRTGAGYVTLACPAGVNDILEVKLTEIMTLPLPDVRRRACLSLRTLGELRSFSKKVDVVAVGPGLGSHHETKELVRRFVGGCDGTVILDADGINAYAGAVEELAQAPCAIVLTPHVGELARLTGREIGDILADPIDAARSAASVTGKIVLLKGAPTVIASPAGETWINITGNESLATAGTGDVLTGIITGLAAQGLAPLNAAVLGAFIHGGAGEKASKTQGIHGVVAGDVLDAVPGTMTDILHGRM